MMNPVVLQIEETPQFLHLRKETIVLPERENLRQRQILVMESCGLTNTREAHIDREIKSSPLILSFINPVEQFGAARLYTDMAGCSFGDVPSFLEFLAMPRQDILRWLDCLVRVDPQKMAWITEMSSVIQKADMAYFASLGLTPVEQTEEEAKEQAGKKKRKLRKSASG